jgi:hypothetical protein
MGGRSTELRTIVKSVETLVFEGDRDGEDSEISRAVKSLLEFVFMVIVSVSGLVLDRGGDAHDDASDCEFRAPLVSNAFC